jgi:hypothetical protein
MDDKEILNRAKTVIPEEQIVDYRPAVFEGSPDTMCEFSAVIPNIIMIWLKNGDCIWYKATE